MKIISDELKNYISERIGMDIHVIFQLENTIDYIKENNGHLNGELKEVIGNTGWIVCADMKRVNIDKVLSFWFSDR